MPAEGDEMRSPSDVGAIARDAGDVLDRLRAKSPRVHCITNSVAQNFTANILLALGAQPSMTIAAEEIEHFAGSADALLVNLGTFDRERSAAIEIAVAAAQQAKRPWVLDPVLIDRSLPRATLARTLIGKRPNVMRLNSAEFSALDGQDVAPFAAQTGTVVALSGATDVIADGLRCAAILNGDPLMARVTAMGCGASAIVAACLAIEDDAFVAACAALLILGVAGEIAGEQAKGPGGFAAAILDGLHGLDAAALIDRARVS